VNRFKVIKQTESRAIATVELDPQLLLTPEFDREYSSPLQTRNLPSVKKEYKTPACKSACALPSTTGKKAYATDLCSLTSSLVKKKRSVGKALQFQSMTKRNVVRIYIYLVVFAQKEHNSNVNEQ
jgi:hypothetical protein